MFYRFIVLRILIVLKSAVIWGKMTLVDTKVEVKY